MTKKRLRTIIILFFIVVFVVPMTITYFVHDYYFGDRIVHDNSYYEYLSEINPSFMKQETSFLSNEDQELHGAFYYQGHDKDVEALVVWVHGMGVSYENYLAEIEYLTKQNYVVFSYNNTGVDNSEGESLKGLIQAPIDLQHALIYIDSLEEYNELPIILIGHSWGGFAVSAVHELEIPCDIDGIVSLAGFWKNINVIEDIGNYYVGDVVSLLVPYLTVYEQVVFGEYASLNGVDGLVNTDCDVLMIHSQDDVIVSYENNFMYYQENFGADDRFEFISYLDAGHKLTIKKDSYERIHDIMHHQMELDSESSEYQELEVERLQLITDFNEDVMENIFSFCQSIVNK